MCVRLSDVLLGSYPEQLVHDGMETVAHEDGLTAHYTDWDEVTSTQLEEELEPWRTKLQGKVAGEQGE